MTSLRRILRSAALLGLLGGGLGAATAPASALNDGEYPKQWGLQVIGATAAWDAGVFGEGVEIAVIDTGVHLDHRDLKANIGPGRDFTAEGTPPQDDNRHGTHVAGIAAAAIDNGGTVGVAPKARIIPLKVLEADGGGSGANVGRGDPVAADNGAEVINLSLGEFTQPVFGPSTEEAVRHAWSKGSICVFAAGNDFVLTSGFNDEPALVVSSTSRNDRESDFSSGVGNAMWGIAAPGGAASVLERREEDVFSTIWESDNKTDTYAYLAGTSMAAPHVAGAAALLRGAGLSPQQTVDRLLQTAKDLGEPGKDATFGHGRLDVAKAVTGPGGPAARASAPAPAPSPAPAPAPAASSAPPTTAAPAPSASPTPAGPTTSTTARRGTPVPATPPSLAAPAAPAAPTAGETTTTPAPVPAATPEAPAADAAVVEPDDSFVAAGGSGESASSPGDLATSERSTRWPWVVLATMLALGVGGAAAWLLWRRRAEAAGPTTTA